MIKTYKTRKTGYRIIAYTPKGSVPVSFKRGYIGISTIMGCTYETDDVELQKAIEEHPEFGSVFWTDDKEEVVEVKEEVQDEPKRVKRYKNKD
jgi:hypothetical protein